MVSVPLQSVNPATGKTVNEFEQMEDEQVEEIITSVHKAQKKWAKVNFSGRAEVLKQVAEQLRKNSENHAELMAREMGKPLSEGKSEAEKCAWVCEYYAENARDHLSSRLVETDASKSYVTYRPLGVILAVMPWNYPFWQVFRFAAPNLMAGNGALLKHASNVQGCALEIESIFRRTEMPSDIFRTLTIGSDRVEGVIKNDNVRAVTLTGSTPAGESVGSSAGDTIKKTVLELGGSDPYLVLEDADLDIAVEACVDARLLNSGQSCIAAKRFLVLETIRDEFVERFLSEMENRSMDNPLEDPDLGPQARTDLRDDLHDQVQRSLDAGARCLLGGKIPEREGAYYPPTVLDRVEPGLPAFDEELFGPVASIITVDDEEEAISLANESKFDLGGAVFTEDRQRGERIASEELEAGCCFVNTFVRSDPRLPFGGVKKSGYGRELSREGIREFVNTKTVYVK